MNLEEIIDNFFSYSDKGESTFKENLTLYIKKAIKAFQEREKNPLFGQIQPQKIAPLFSNPQIPQQGEDVNLVLQEIFQSILASSVSLSHPHFIGHMTQATPNFMPLCDFIIGLFNQNLVKMETSLASTFLEAQTLMWLHQLIFEKPKEFYPNYQGGTGFTYGNMCSGGTIANLTALTVARNHAFPNINKIGIFSAFIESGHTSAVILVSKRGHYSLQKSASILGLGENAVVEIPCEAFSNQIDLCALEKTILDLQKKKTKIIALVGIAGSTETGSIDDLQAMANIAQKYNIWFHVDAAWGGALALSSHHKVLLDGIQQADSVTLDGHKFFYLPISHSMVLFQNPNSLEAIKHHANYILRKESLDLGKTSLEGSRRFDSLKLWFAFKLLGQKGYETLIETAIQKGQMFADMIEQHPDFEVTSRYTSGIVTYRFHPKALKDVDNHAKSSPEKKEKINLFLNKLNSEIQKKQRANGHSFVSRTLLESFFPGQQIVVLRALPFNPLTNETILAEILLEQSNLGHELFALEKDLARGFISF